MIHLVLNCIGNDINDYFNLNIPNALNRGKDYIVEYFKF